MNVARAEVARRLERFKAAFKQAGVKLTHQRLEIFREVAAQPRAPRRGDGLPGGPGEDADSLARHRLYRTLSLLSDLGLVRPLGPRRESVRFDANLARHHHYVCLRCGLTRDLASSALDGIRIPGTVKDLGSVVAMQVEVRGLCASCARARTPAVPTRESPRKRIEGRTT